MTSDPLARSGIEIFCHVLFTYKTFIHDNGILNALLLTLQYVDLSFRSKFGSKDIRGLNKNNVMSTTIRS